MNAEPQQINDITIKFEELFKQLSTKATPDFGYVVDPTAPEGVVSINQSHDAVVHPDDHQRLVTLVLSAGWNPINQT